MLGMTSMETLCNLGCIKSSVAVVDRLLGAVVSRNIDYHRYERKDGWIGTSIIKLRQTMR
jgi:hypothetical protein